MAPTKPASGYIGGKRNLAGRIVPIIDRLEHRGYAEPFVGMGGIFLRRRRRVTAEIINDISGDVTNFFRVVREHHGFFMDTMRWLIAGRAEFQRQLALPAEQLTDLQRAARFLYVQRLAFGGKVEGRHFGVAPGQAARFNVLRLERDLADLHDRLAGVVIEKLPFDQLIARYDRADMLFYLDPPYWGCEDDYGQDVFCRADFERLSDQLAGVKAKFLLSINDTPGARACFARFAMVGVDTTYTVGPVRTRSGELIVSNFAIGDMSRAASVR
ncbi:MAG: DNA adenine methylase [Pseudomonadota bacterium]